MPAIQPVVVKDRTATPVNHTYVPADVSGGVGALVERNASGSYVGEPRLTAAGRVAANNRSKSHLKMSFPKVVNEIINGVTVPRVVGTSYVKVDFDWDKTHDAIDRNHIEGMVASALGDATAQPFLHPVLTGASSVYSG